MLDAVAAARELDQPPARRHVLLAVGAVLVCTGAVRWYAAAAHLPEMHNTDEIANLAVAERMVDDGDLNPRFFNYPGLALYVSAAELAVADAGEGVVEMQSLGNGRATRPGVVLAVRLTMVLAGLVTAAAAAWAVFGATRRWAPATLAAAVVGVSTIDLRATTTIAPDALAGMGTALALAGALTYLRRPTLAVVAAAGVAVGVAAASKYNAVLAAIAVVAAVAVVPAPWRRRVAALAVAGAATVAVFLALNPYALLDVGAFTDDLAFEQRHYRTGHPGAEGGALARNLGWLWWSAGPALVAGLGIAADRSRRTLGPALVAGSFALVYLLFVSSYTVRFERNLTSLTAAVAVLAALGIDALTRHNRALGAVTSVVVLGWGAIATVGDLAPYRRDPWRDAQSWFVDHVPASSTVAIEQYSFFVDPQRYDVTVAQRLIDDPTWTDADVVIASARAFARFTERSPGSSEAAAYAELFASTCPVAELGRGLDRWLVRRPGEC